MRLSLLALVALVAFFIAAAPASAQTPSPMAYWQNDAGVVLEPLSGPVPDWRVSAGFGAAALPKYEGDDHIHFEPVPAFDIRYRDTLFLSSGDGAGINLLHGDTYRAGVAVGYDTGRDPHITLRTQGLKDIDAAPEPRLFAEAAYLPFVFTADIRKAVGGHEGVIGDLGAYMPVVATKSLVVFVGPSLTAANGRYMNAYFGIDRTEQMGSREHLPFYAAEGGLKSATFGVNAVYNIDAHWFIDSDLGFERLLGSAVNSPIVTAANQVGVSVIVGYNF